MGLTSLQVCMDSSEWFQGTIQEEIAAGMDSSSSPSGMSDPMLAAACSRPLMERRLRPQQDQALKCPRCDSTHTKFCYYNNYSLTQPRYFCKTCRRYWTKGGTLRNIPVGGGCRKNKKVSSNSKKQPTSACTPINHHNNSHVSNDNLNNNNINNIIQHHPNFMNPNNHHLIMNSTDLQLSYPDHQANLFGIGNSSFMFENLSNGVATRAIEFMEGGVGGGGGGYGGYTAEMGGGNLNILGQNYHGGNLCSPFGGMTLDSINNPFMERSGLINAYSNNQDHQGRINVNVNVHEDHHGISSSLDVKPKLLALEWQDQSCSSDHHGGGGGSSGGGGGGGYLTGLGSSWGGIVNGYGASTSNPLV